MADEGNIEGVPLSVPSLPPTPSRYCNSVLLNSSQWDFTLHFAQLVPAPSTPGEAPSIQYLPIESIAMSPQHTKAFLSVLRQHVETWENQFGEIKVPADMGKGESS